MAAVRLSPAERLTRWAYALLTTVLQPLVLLRAVWRARQEPGYAHAPAERLGWYSKASPGADDRPSTPVPLLWIHAVSLGETRAARILVAALRVQGVPFRLLLTHSTATGWAEGQASLQPGDRQTWLPWDAPGPVRRFLRTFQPSVGVLMETELWPVLTHGCRSARVPLLMVNGRLNARSLRAALRLAWLSRPAYAALDGLWAQTPEDAQRFAQAGRTPDGVLGNLKFDAPPNPEARARGLQWRQRLGRPVVMLASAREGEEAAFFKEILALAHGSKQLFAAENEVLMPPIWLVVPRHPQRFDAVARLAETMGFRVGRRRDWPVDGPSSPQPHAQPELWLGDSLGEMELYYSLSTVALLGGSFGPWGGQNLIEAAACGCPVVMGPHTFNFQQAAERAEAEGAAVRVPDMAGGLAQALQWLANPAGCAQRSAAAVQFSERHRGAAERTATAVAERLARWRVNAPSGR
jgi:3-deoxy-D-manno-octulosonic-acid transferase